MGANFSEYALHMSGLTPEIFGYLDYRQYLSAVYEARKASRGFSFRAFSKLAGFSSPNFIKLVIDGERNLSPQAAAQLGRGLKLSGQSLEYFKVLVAMNQTPDDGERVALLARLQELMPHGRRREVGADGVQYLSSWLFPVIRDLVAAKHFREDAYWISRRLRGRVSAEEVRHAIQFLLKHNYVRRTTEGKLEVADDVVLSSDEVRSLAVRAYHRSMLGEAIDALSSVPIEEREFGALTVAISRSAIPELKSRIKAFRAELHTWIMAQGAGVGTEAQQEIIQINIQMFPHTGGGVEKPRDEKEKSYNSEVA